MHLRSNGDLSTLLALVLLAVTGPAVALEPSYFACARDGGPAPPGGEAAIHLMLDRDARRLVALPASLAGREVAGTRLANGVLSIRFR